MKQNCITIFFGEEGPRNVAKADDPRQSYALWWAAEVVDWMFDYEHNYDYKSFTPSWEVLDAADREDWKYKEFPKSSIDFLTVSWCEKNGMASCAFAISGNLIIQDEKMTPHDSKAQEIFNRIQKYLEDCKDIKIKKLHALIYKE